MPAHDSSLKVYFMCRFNSELFIKNVLLVKNKKKKKNTANYTSTVNQINLYWGFF